MVAFIALRNAAPWTRVTMAYILRSLAVIGVIALNSPVREPNAAPPAVPVGEISTALDILAKLDPKAATAGAPSLREAAEILAGLEPETRARFMALAANGPKQGAHGKTTH